jgi:NADH-quinone oxidoreductase subunit I
MFGTGLLKGLGITFKHLVDTYKDDMQSTPARYQGSDDRGKSLKVIDQPVDQEGLLTIQYPEERRLLPERFRYIPMLIWDTETDEERCTACGICAKVCPPQCIWIVRDSDENGKPVTRCSEFYIDAAVCMSCSFCVEFCPFDAIKMNHDYELAVYDRYPQLVYDMEELTVPLEYYAALWPTQYEEEQARRKEEEEEKRKQEEEKAAKAAARAAAKSAAAAEKPAAGAPKRSAAELQALAKERAAQRQAQAAEGGGDDDAAAAKRARMEDLKRRAQERARQRKQDSGQ